MAGHHLPSLALGRASRNNVTFRDCLVNCSNSALECVISDAIRLQSRTIRCASSITCCAAANASSPRHFNSVSVSCLCNLAPLEKEEPAGQRFRRLFDPYPLYAHPHRQQRQRTRHGLRGQRNRISDVDDLGWYQR